MKLQIIWTKDKRGKHVHAASSYKQSVDMLKLGARTESPADKIPRGQNPRDLVS